MADEVPMVTSCPLCLAPDEVSSMVTIEIERAFPKGPAAIMICRSCAGAVIRACDGIDPPLVDPKVFQLIARAEAPADSEAEAAWRRSVGAPAADETQAESVQLHEGDEPDDGKTTD